MKLVTSFVGPDGKKWRLYHADRRQHRALFDIGERYLAIGVTVFRGPHRRKIFIDSRQSKKLIFETTLHELMHVALHDLGLEPIIEEAFVDRVSCRVAYMLEQL